MNLLNLFVMYDFKASRRLQYRGHQDRLPDGIRAARSGSRPDTPSSDPAAQGHLLPRCGRKGRPASAPVHPAAVPTPPRVLLPARREKVARRSRVG